MSRFDMYKPDNQERFGRSHSPLDKKLLRNTPSSNLLQVPKISLVYYKKLIKSKEPQKNCPKLAYKGKSLQKLNLTGKNDEHLSPEPYKSLVLLLKSEDLVNRIKTAEMVKQMAEEFGLNRKSASKLLSKLNNSFENRKSESPLPKISKHFQPLKPQFKRLPPSKQKTQQKPHKKDLCDALNDEKICAWETDSLK